MLAKLKKDSHGTAETLRAVEFRLRTASGRSVFLVGSFNRWDYQMHPLEEAGRSGNYSIIIDLPKGYYDYKFVVDGQYVTDPENRARNSDGAGGHNSVVNV